VAATDSDHHDPIFPDLARGRIIDGPNQLWVADITYIAIATGFVYLPAILGAWSRRVIGYAISRWIDARVGLVQELQEPFVAGADTTIDRIVADIPKADWSFTLIFSSTPFPSHRGEADGNWYYSADSTWNLGCAPHSFDIFPSFQNTFTFKQGRWRLTTRRLDRGSYAESCRPSQTPKKTLTTGVVGSGSAKGSDEADDPCVEGDSNGKKRPPRCLKTSKRKNKGG
jgi:hypothetical protein